MKLEDLIKLGIPEETAKQVIAASDAETAAVSKQLADKTAELTTATNTITSLSEKVKAFDGVDLEKLKKDAAEWEKKYGEDTAALKLDNAVMLALTGSGALDAKLTASLIDKQLLKLDDKGGVIGLDEQLTKIKTDKSFLFSTKEQENPVVTGMTTGAAHTAPAGGSKELTLGNALTEHYNVNV